MNHEHDPTGVPEALRRRYRRGHRAEPRSAIDQAVLRYARSESGRAWRERPQLVWPLAAAASLLLAIGGVAWLAPRLPAPGYGQVRLPAPIRLPEYPELPGAAVGGEPDRGSINAQGVLEYRSPAAAAGADRIVAAESGENRGEEARQQALDQLQALADRGRIADSDLLMAYAALHAQWPDLAVPPTLTRAVEEALARAQRPASGSDAR